MSVRITDNTSKILNETKIKANVFLRLMTDEVVNESTPKTPKKSGRLRSDITKSVLALKGKIVWGKKYAAKQETTQFKNYTTAGTGPHYAENAVRKAVNKTSSIAKKAGLK